MTIRKRNNFWEYRFEIAKVDGKRKRISKSGFKTKKECESAALKAQNYYKNGGLLTDYAEISFSDLLDLWLEVMKPTWKQSTYDLYSKIIELKIKKSLGTYKVKSLSPVAIQKYINEIYSELSPNYAKLIKIVLCSAMKYATTPLGIIPSSPCEYIKIPKHEQITQTKTLEEDIFSICDNVSEPFRTALLVSYFTGMRIGEVFALNWNDIDLKGKTINVDKTLSYSGNSWRISTPKTKTSIRVIPIGDSLCRILSNHKAYQLKNKVYYGKFYVKNYLKDSCLNHESGEETDFVFTTKWGEFAKPSEMQRICRKFGFKFHQLRHTHATKLIESGISPKIVQERLGHSNITTTLQTYTHPTKEMQLEAVRVFEMGTKRTQIQ